jgi:hypothetical protein
METSRPRSRANSEEAQAPSPNGEGLVPLPRVWTRPVVRDVRLQLGDLLKTCRWPCSDQSTGTEKQVRKPTTWMVRIDASPPIQASMHEDRESPSQR